MLFHFFLIGFFRNIESGTNQRLFIVNELKHTVKAVSVILFKQPRSH